MVVVPTSAVTLNAGTSTSGTVMVVAAFPTRVQRGGCSPARAQRVAAFWREKLQSNLVAVVEDDNYDMVMVREKEIRVRVSDCVKKRR